MILPKEWPKPSREDILIKVKEILVKNGAPRSQLDKLGPEEDLFDRGVLDSIGLIALVLKLEGEFGIKLPLADFDPWNFNTLAGIVRLLSASLGLVEKS